MQQNVSNRANELANNGYYFNSSYYFYNALDLLKSQWVVLSTFTAFYTVLSYFVLHQPQVGQIILMIVSGPITAGYYLSINRIKNGEIIRFNNLFDGFNNFIPTMLTSMLSGLLIYLGLFLLVLPGIFLYVVYLFAIPLVVFAKLEFWPALESSRIVLTVKFWEVFRFAIMIAGINILGIFALGIGVFFTIPLSYAMILMAYEDIYGLDEESKIDNSFSHFR